MNRPIVTQRQLLVFKWLMIVLPPVTVAVGHTLLGPELGIGHRLRGPAETLLVTILVTTVALLLAYLFVETLFTVLRGLQAEAMARQQEILILNAVMQERERLSRDLHDGAAQLVADVLLRLDMIKELVVTERAAEAEAQLERLRAVADELYADIGESIAGLRTNVRERGLVFALQDYVEQFEERHQIPTSLQAAQFDAAADRLPLLAALQLFRVVQEALTNVRKHAQAQQATVTLTVNGPERLTIVIADDGRGFAPDDQLGGDARPLGLTSMRERVEALGGTLQVKSRPGAGTRVVASIPVPQIRTKSEHAALTTPAR